FSSATNVAPENRIQTSPANHFRVISSDGWYNAAGLPKPDPAKTVAGRRSFSEAEKHRIVEEASQPGVSLSQVARRYGIYRRLLFRWGEELRPKPAESDPPCCRLRAGVDRERGSDCRVCGGSFGAGDRGR